MTLEQFGVGTVFWLGHPYMEQLSDSLVDYSIDLQITAFNSTIHHWNKFKESHVLSYRQPRVNVGGVGSKCVHYRLSRLDIITLAYSLFGNWRDPIHRHRTVIHVSTKEFIQGTKNGRINMNA